MEITFDRFRFEFDLEKQAVIFKYSPVYTSILNELHVRLNRDSRWGCISIAHSFTFSTLNFLMVLVAMIISWRLIGLTTKKATEIFFQWIIGEESGH